MGSGISCLRRKTKFLECIKLEYRRVKGKERKCFLGETRRVTGRFRYK